jgi:hypothetical protein
MEDLQAGIEQLFGDAANMGARYHSSHLSTEFVAFTDNYLAREATSRRSAVRVTPWRTAERQALLRLVLLAS